MFYSAAMIVISLYFMAMPVAGFKEVQAILNLSHKMKVAGECWRAPARNRAWSIHNQYFHIFPRLASASEVWQLVKLEAVSWPLLRKWPGETPRRSKE